MKNLLKTPFASALAGGLVVAVLGMVAIATGLVDADGQMTTTTTTVPAASPSTALASNDAGDALSVAEIYDRDSAGVVYIEAQQEAQPTPFNPYGPQGGGGTATGSGFVIDTDGHILTNAHVVEGSDAVTVRVGGEDGDTFDAKVIGADASTDVAVLEVTDGADQLEPLELGSSGDVEVGQPVVAIGNPFGLDRTVTAGIVSAVQRQISAPNGFAIENVIQTDAPINPGNSGGPLIDANGQVIGINSQIEAAGGQGNVGIGFAVPIDTAQEVARQLIDTGEVQHAFVGISGADITPEIAGVLNLEEDSGALVQSVVPDSPAAEAGIEAGEAQVSVAGQRIRAGGDLITAVDGEPVASMDDVVAAVDSKQPGDEIELTVVRAGEERNVTVELTDRPEDAQG
jgi:S1-C subfamily serine protease